MVVTDGFYQVSRKVPVRQEIRSDFRMAESTEALFDFYRIKSLATELPILILESLTERN